MDGLVFYKLLHVMRQNISGAKLNRVSIAGGSVYFSFYTDHVINYEYRTAPTPPLLSLCESISGDSPGALDAVSGASVTDIKAFGYDRVGLIELKKRKPSGKLVEYKAIIEPTGNYANFFLLDSAGIILFSLSSRTIDPDRNIGAGNIYTLPRANKKYSLDNFEGAVSFNELAGFYPTSAKHADIMLQDMTFSEAASKIKASLSEGDIFYIDKASKIMPFPIPESLCTISHENIAEYYKRKEHDKDSRAGDKIKKIFVARKDKYARLVLKLEEELEQASAYETIKEEAELLKANLYKIKSSGEYIFERYTESGVEEIKYKIDPETDPKDKCEKLFKKSARLKRSIPMIEERLEEAKQMVQSAEEQLYYAENAENETLLGDFERLIASEEKHTKQPKDKKNTKKSFYETKYEGYSIFAGRNSVSNHELVFRYALDSDIWFHARNIPSAHVVVRLEGGERLNEEIIINAASIAASLSKKKNEQKVDIDYTFVKYVNKPKNTPIGFVTYKKFKTITAAPFPEHKIDELFNR